MAQFGNSSNVEGWTWLINATKWHYIRDGMSLCRRWAVLGNPTLEQDDSPSPDNCKACYRIRLKEIEKTKEKP